MNGLVYFSCALIVSFIVVYLAFLIRIPDNATPNNVDVVIAIMGKDEKSNHLLPYLLDFVENLKQQHKYAVWLSTDITPTDGFATQHQQQLGNICWNHYWTAAEKWFYSVQHKFHGYSIATNDASYEAAFHYALALGAQSILVLTPTCLLYKNSTFLQDLLLNGHGNSDIIIPKLETFPSAPPRCPNDTKSKWHDSRDHHMPAAGYAQTFSETGDLNRADLFDQFRSSCFLIKTRKAFRAFLTSEAHLNNPNALSVGMGVVVQRSNLTVSVAESKHGIYGVMLNQNERDDDAEKVHLDLDHVTNLLTLLYASEKYDVLSPTTMWPRAHGAHENGKKSLRQRRHESIQSYLARVVVVNLDRRPDRLKLMKCSLDALGKLRLRAIKICHCFG